MNKFSIITVCLNMESEIEKTIESILHQTYTNFEYIIKDGGSADKTVAIAESYAPAFAEKDISFRVISGPDGGIYDAMNQSVQEAKGEWVIFMNAGDQFAWDSVLEKVENNGCLRDADIVFGDCISRSRKMFIYRKVRPLEEIRYSMPFCHQSTFTRREIFNHYSFSLQYKICSDYKFFLELYLDGKKFAYYPNAVAIFDIYGISSNWKLGYQDTIRMLEEMPVRDEMAIQRMKHNLKVAARREYREQFMHRCLWRYVPEKLRVKRRERMYRKAGWKTEEEFFGTRKDSP